MREAAPDSMLMSRTVALESPRYRGYGRSDRGLEELQGWSHQHQVGHCVGKIGLGKPMLTLMTRSHDERFITNTSNQVSPRGRTAFIVS